MTGGAPSRCELLDRLEAAIVLVAPVELTLVDGVVVRGTPVAMVARAGDDWVTLADGVEVGVGAIAGVTGPG